VGYHGAIGASDATKERCSVPEHRHHPRGIVGTRMGKITRAGAERDALASERLKIASEAAPPKPKMADALCPRCGAAFSVPAGRPQGTLCDCGWLLLVTPHPFGGVTTDDVVRIVNDGERNMLNTRRPALDSQERILYEKQHTGYLEACRKLQETLVRRGALRVWKDGDRAGLRWSDGQEDLIDAKEEAGESPPPIDVG
jgi:hypothetical protein